MGACGSTLMKPCLGETDVRYNASYPKTILGTDPRWEKFHGFFRVNVTTFDAVNGQLRQPGPIMPWVGTSRAAPFQRDNTIGFYNHTIIGSRLIVNRYYFNAPAPEAFCRVPFEPPLLNAPPGVTCGVNGLAQFAGVYAALNHENDGSLTVARATGSYADDGNVFKPEAGSGIKMLDGNTFEQTFNVEDSFSNVNSFVFFDNGTATLGAVHTIIPRKQIGGVNAATMVRITEEDFLSGIAEYNEKYNIPEINRVESPMMSDEVPSLPGTFLTEREWCGGLVDDVSCTASPYEEPDAKMKGGFIALFVIIGVFLIGAAAFLLHRKATNDQKRRYKEHVVRGIARNITIAASAGQISSDQLKKEFNRIDADGGGTIGKGELKEFLASGKVGTISDKDFEALWHAIDIDDSGQVDFVEFITFLGGCGTEFDAVSREQKAMSKDEKMKYASQRLSRRVLQMPDDEEEGEVVEGDAAVDDKA